MSQPEPRRHRMLLTGALMLCLSLPGCGRLRRGVTEAPTESPTEPAIIAAMPRVRDTESPPTEPLPTPDVYATFQAELMATLVAATSATARRAATGPAVVGTAGLPAAGPEPGCEVVREPLGLSLIIDPAAPQPTRPSVPYADSYLVEVLEHNTETRKVLLAAVEPALPFRLRLGYTGDPPPAEVAPPARLRVKHYDDLHLRESAGEGVLISDDRGLLLLGVNVRETEGAHARVLGGDRAGWTVEQLPTACRYAPMNACGFELRAAPVRFRSPDGLEQVLSPGDQATLSAPGRPSYRVRLANSHVRLWRGDLPCPDPVDWVLSYRIQREPTDATPAAP